MARSSGNTVGTKCCRPRRCSRQDAIGFVKNNWVLLASLSGVFIGLILGLALRPAQPSRDVILWIKIWGELFLRMIKMIILPLITSSLIIGLSSMRSRTGGIVGGVTIGYVLSTTLVATIEGVLLAVAIHPGSNLGGTKQSLSKTENFGDVFADLLRNIFPDNIIQACLQHVYTKSDAELINATANITEQSKKLVYRDGMNILGVIVFSAAFGTAISAAGNAAKVLYPFFCAINDVVFKMMDAIVLFAPFGIVSLIAGAILETASIEEAGQSLGMFVLCVLVGNLIHQLFCELLLFIFLRKNPFWYHYVFLDGIVAGLAPPSSAAALPFMLSACEQKLDVDDRVAKYVLPVHVVINKDGSAMFICMAAIFIAQTYGIYLPVHHIIVTCILTTCLSLATAAVPSSSIVLLIMVCGALNIPIVERIGLLMTVEWLTDRIRTSTNLVSSSFGCVIIDRICAKYMEGTSGSEGPVVEGDKIPHEEKDLCVTDCV